MRSDPGSIDSIVVYEYGRFLLFDIKASLYNLMDVYHALHYSFPFPWGLSLTATLATCYKSVANSNGGNEDFMLLRYEQRLV